MQPIDWLIMVLPLLICGGIAFYSRRYVRGVADFMAGGRHAGRYLICTARAEQGADGVGYVGMFQIFLVAGFTLHWWNQIAIPVTLFLAVSGYVIYRYRQTRAMTIGQFFEMRYSRRFRLCAGFLGFFAGLLNFGIIPALGARFMVFFLNIPQTLPLFHVGTYQVTIPTYVALASLFILIAAMMTTMGGQISVLVTDCAEGMFSQIFYTFVAVALLVLFFRWGHVREVLLNSPVGESKVNPFDTKEAKTFNIWFVLINLTLMVYRNISWQSSHAFNSSAASPHEARMGQILGRWKYFASVVMVMLLGLCAMLYLKTPEGDAAVKAVQQGIADSATQKQMRVPIALSQILPPVVKGALASICLMGVIASIGMHFHSWGSIFIQDIVLPLQKQPLSPQQHLRVLRLAVMGVAVWALFFGALVPITEYIPLWWIVTESIFVSGAAIAILGGLYWSRGTTAGAWTGLVVGASVAMVGFCVHSYFEHHGKALFFNLQHVAAVASVAAVICYTVVSLLTCRTPHNMDKLLHRGAYAVESPPDEQKEVAAAKPSLLARIFNLRMDDHFTRSDRWLTIAITAWGMLWFTVFVVGTLMYKFVHHWSDAAWANYWLVQGICIPLVMALVTTVWFTIGAWRDMRVFFRRLREEAVNLEDDGSVKPAVAPKGFEVIPVAEKVK